MQKITAALGLSCLFMLAGCVAAPYPAPEPAYVGGGPAYEYYPAGNYYYGAAYPGYYGSYGYYDWGYWGGGRGHWANHAHWGGYHGGRHR